MSKSYEMAMEKSAEAIKIFRLAQSAYRARTIGDSEFIAARAKYNTAMKEYDADFASEQN